MLYKEAFNTFQNEDLKLKCIDELKSGRKQIQSNYLDK